MVRSVLTIWARRPRTAASVSGILTDINKSPGAGHISATVGGDDTSQSRGLTQAAVRSIQLMEYKRTGAACRPNRGEEDEMTKTRFWGGLMAAAVLALAAQNAAAQD